MSSAYPQLDSVENKSSSHPPQDYQYVEPPKSSHASLDYNQNNLNENLLPNPDAPNQVENPNKQADRVGAVFLLIEFAVIYVTYHYAYIFEFCFWSFGMRDYKETEYWPSKMASSGGIWNFYDRLGCETQDFSRCPGICGLISRYENALIWVLIAYFLRIILTGIASYFTASESKKRNFAKAKKMFIIFNALANISLVVGIFCGFSTLGFEDLAEPVELDDDLSPQKLEWKFTYWLIVFLPAWVIITNLIAYSRLKSA